MHSMPFVSMAEASLEARAAQFTFLSDILTEATEDMNIVASIFVKHKRDNLWTGSHGFF